MISFLRELAALPLKFALEILKILRMNSATQLVLIRWIWKIGHEREWAYTYLLYTWAVMGEEEVKKVAEQLLIQEKDAYIAYYIGHIEFHAKKEIQSAQRWIQKAEEMNCAHPEALLYLKLRMSGLVPEYMDENLVQKILDRNDLSMEESRFALLAKVQLFIKHKEWDKADEILDRMLCIESYYKIHICKWITSLARGDQAFAIKHLNAAGKTCENEQLYIEQAVGLYWLGKSDQARDFLLKGLRDEEHRQAVLYFQPYLAELLKNSET